MNLRTRIMVMGGLLGALVGVSAAYLYLQANPVDVDEEGREQLPSIQPGKAITAVLGILTAIRQIVSMGRPS